MSAPHALRTVAVVPTYDNPRTVGATVAGIVERGLAVVLVDDGSAPEGAAACVAAASHPDVTLVRRARNGGKGAAVRDGFERALELGATHAFQIDGDGQHDLDAIDAFLAASRARPEALVLGRPVYGDDAPRVRTFARDFTSFWVRLETGGRARVDDAMIGFRVYPLAAALASRTRGTRMEFDIEIVVRMVRRGVPVENLPVGVRYLAPEEGGVSHFRLLRDNLRFSWLHCRLCTAGAFGWMAGRLAAPFRSDGGAA